MKILFVSKAYFPSLGGVETVVRQLAAGMCARGHESAVLCFGERGGSEYIDGAEVRRVRPLGHIGSAPIGFRFINEFLRLSKWADVINFHSPNPMGEAAFVMFSYIYGKHRKKTVCTYHGDAQRPKFLLSVYDALLRRFLRRCDAVAASTPPLSANSRVLKADAVKEKTRIIPLGVRTENYENHRSSDLEKARRLLVSLPAPSFKVMYAGRMVYYKGIEDLLGALKILKEQGRPVSAFLVGSGPEERGVKTFIARNALENDIIVIPHQPEGVYRALFSLADCFVLPSTHKTEAYGIVLAEAMASGLPVISTELGTGTTWVNRDGETGIAVPPGNPDILAQSIDRLAGGEKERRRMAAASRVRAKAFFEEETMLTAYEEMFRAVGSST